MGVSAISLVAAYVSCDEWGGGREPWERSEAGGVNDNERQLRHSPVSESHGGAPEGIKGGVTTVEDERGPGLDFSLCFVCGSRP